MGLEHKFAIAYAMFEHRYKLFEFTPSSERGRMSLAEVLRLGHAELRTVIYDVARVSGLVVCTFQL